MSDLQDVTLAFVGSGVMAEAMIKGLLNEKLIDPSRIIASDPRLERVQELAAQYGVKGTTDNRQAAEAAQIVVLSVKPQVLPTVLKGLEGKIMPEGLVLSIVAGAKITVIGEGLGHGAIVIPIRSDSDVYSLRGQAFECFTDPVPSYQVFDSCRICGQFLQDVFYSLLFSCQCRIDPALDATAQLFEHSLHRIQLGRVSRLENGLQRQRSSLLASMTGSTIPDHAFQIPLTKGRHQVFLAHTLHPVPLEFTREWIDTQE